MVNGLQALRDEVLIAELASARGWRRVELAAALGDSEGRRGPDVLRALLSETGRGTVDLRCAALISLAKRCGAEASADFGAALRGPGAVQDYAALCLAAFGEAGYWRQMYDWLVRKLNANTLMSDPTYFEVGMTYLLLFATGQSDLDRLRRLIDRFWPRLEHSDRKWLEAMWPAAVRGKDADAAEPEAEVMRRALQPDAERMRRSLRADAIFTAPATDLD